jgi:hypothetical protein
MGPNCLSPSKQHFETINVLLGRILSHDLGLNATSERIVGKDKLEQ